jgi:hypothetical protein
MVSDLAGDIDHGFKFRLQLLPTKGLGKPNFRLKYFGRKKSLKKFNLLFIFLHKIQLSYSYII